MLEQLDLLGEQVVPVLRRELDALRPADVPDAPTHASLLAAKRLAEADAGSTEDAAHAVVTDTVTGRAPELEGSLR